MIKINPHHHAICEKCEKPFTDPNAVVITELNHVNGMLHDIVLCHIAVSKIPGFRSNDWADKLSMWHRDCFPGLNNGSDHIWLLRDSIKDLVTNQLDKKEQDDLYRYLHHSLGCRI